MTGTAAELIKQVMVEKFGVDEDQITDGGDIFSDFGFDSLDGVELIIAVEEAADIDVPDEILDRQHMTVSELAAELDKLLASKVN